MQMNKLSKDIKTEEKRETGKQTEIELQLIERHDEYVELKHRIISYTDMQTDSETGEWMHRK